MWDGPEEVPLQKLAKQLDIEERIHFKGRIGWGDSLFSIYRQAHLLFVTSVTESGPRVVIEAMTSGLPVLSTPVGLVPDVLDTRMIVPSWDVSSWSRAICSAVNDPATLNDMAWRNYHRSKDFEFDMLYSRRLSFYAAATQLGTQKGTL